MANETNKVKIQTKGLSTRGDRLFDSSLMLLPRYQIMNNLSDMARCFLKLPTLDSDVPEFTPQPCL